MSEIRQIILNLNIDILAVQESRLDISMIDDYLFFRNDPNRHGGGIVLYIAPGLIPELCPELQTSDIGSLWVTVTLKS